MNRIFQHIILTTWLLTLLFSSVGVNIHTLYCLCKGELEVSFFQIESQCEKKKEELAQLPDCCKNAALHCLIDTNEEKHDCTDEEVKFVKLEVDYLPASISFDWLSTFAILQDIPIQIFNNFRISKVFAMVTNKAPPLPGGYFLRIIIQSFLC